MLNNAEVKQNVEHELSLVAWIGPPSIVVSVNHGVVTLSGLVHSFSDKVQAGRCAAGVAGGAGVLNNIEVALLEGERSDADLARAAAAAVKAQLPNSADTVTVLAQHGMLRLEGTLGWNYQRKRAEEAVYALCGVRGVENRIALAPKARQRCAEREQAPRGRLIYAMFTQCLFLAVETAIFF